MNFENLPRFGPKIGTLSTPGGHLGPNFFPPNFYFVKLFRYDLLGIQVIKAKNLFVGQKRSFHASIEQRAKKWRFLLRTLNILPKILNLTTQTLIS